MMNQTNFTPTERRQLDAWLADSKTAAEVNDNAVPNLHHYHEQALEHEDDSNLLFNYGLTLTNAIQPGLENAMTKPLSAGGHQISNEAEQAYKAALDLFANHGRANIMLGLLYNQLGKYIYSEKYLEVGLELQEGEKDWMIAANQYLLAGALTNKTDEQKYQNVYEKFKEFAHQDGIGNGPYYMEMAGRYVSYYEK